MEGNNLQPPQALIPGAAGAPSDLEQPPPLHSVAQAQTQQAVREANNQQVTTIAAPVENQMQQEVDGNGEKAASPTSKEDDPHGKAPATASQWPSRVNWTADMAKLLVSAAAYVDADMKDADMNELGSRMRRIGKWSLVSSAMTERGSPASPQQCADKFHDLNKRYRRVTELLGYGTACRIVEKPALLEKMKLPEKLKEEARKQLSSKNLHYEQMCSYHNRNKQCLLDDPVLQEMLRRLARGSDPVEQLGTKCPVGNAEGDDDPMSISDDEEDEDDDDESSDDDMMEVSAEEHRHQGVHHATKKLKHGHEEGSQDVAIDMKIIQIQSKRLKIRKETLEMRQSHLERMKSRKEQDKELQKMRLDIEMMELENDKLELELERKIKEMEKMGIKPTKRI